MIKDTTEYHRSSPKRWQHSAELHPFCIRHSSCKSYAAGRNIPKRLRKILQVADRTIAYAINLAQLMYHSLSDSAIPLLSVCFLLHIYSITHINRWIKCSIWNRPYWNSTPNVESTNWALCDSSERFFRISVVIWFRIFPTIPNIYERQRGNSAIVSLF